MMPIIYDGMEGSTYERVGISFYVTDKYGL